MSIAVHLSPPTPLFYHYRLHSGGIENASGGSVVVKLAKLHEGDNYQIL